MSWFRQYAALFHHIFYLLANLVLKIGTKRSHWITMFPLYRYETIYMHHFPQISKLTFSPLVGSEKNQASYVMEFWHTSRTPDTSDLFKKSGLQWRDIRSFWFKMMTQFLTTIYLITQGRKTLNWYLQVTSLFLT